MMPDLVSSHQLQTQQTNTKKNTMWMLSLYGTAIGAGTLFLPIDAGLNGIWPLLMMAILAFPITYFSHQALCRFVLSSSTASANITDVVEEHFGGFAGNVLTVLYFLAIYPILLLYSVAITNTVQSFIINQLGYVGISREWLALLLLMSFMAVIRIGQDMVLRAMSLLVYPFVTILVALSLYLIPYWNRAIIADHSSQPNLLTTLWLIIPLVIFSFNHSPIISSFAVDQKQRYGLAADAQCSLILKNSHVLMVVTVMFFVFSCVFSLSPHDLAIAKQQNISILSYLANHFHNPIIAYIAPLVAFIAIAKSFFGHYLGANEGLRGVLNIIRPNHVNLHSKTVSWITELFIFFTCWLTATMNPNILTIIETLGGPLIAIILFIMPIYAIHKVPSMKHYRHLLSNGLVLLIGIIGMSAILSGAWGTLHG
ncbi:MAG: HAAAP family serine/threonine permease [Legionella sp.]